MADIPEGVTPTSVKQFPARWVNDRGLEQKFADQLLCQIVDDRAYLTFGQVRMPLAPDAAGADIEIESIAKLIVNLSSLKRMLTVLNRLAEEHIKEEF